MLILLILAASSAIATFIIQLLPDDSFLPLPTSFTDALVTGSSWCGWATGVMGDVVQEALLECLLYLISIAIVLLFWILFKKAIWKLIRW